jgi:hypothetical protein
MSGAKKYAWLRIYNDYLDSKNVNAQKGSAAGAKMEHMNLPAHDAVVTERDFFELFRGWEKYVLDPKKSNFEYEAGLDLN